MLVDRFWYLCTEPGKLLPPFSVSFTNLRVASMDPLQGRPECTHPTCKRPSKRSHHGQPMKSPVSPSSGCCEVLLMSVQGI